MRAQTKLFLPSGALSIVTIEVALQAGNGTQANNSQGDSLYDKEKNLLCIVHNLSVCKLSSLLL